jgi:hypothetical protein
VGQTSFSYQGRLTESGVPANGNYDLEFRLWGAVSGGTQVSPAITNSMVAVSNGVFTVDLNFGGGMFDGSARWLSIGLRAAGAVVTFTPLTPRQPITAAPYALYAMTPGGPQGPAGAQGVQGARGLTFKGGWSSATGYSVDDAVLYSGSAWLARRGNVGVSPVEGADWTLLVQKGDTGLQGPQGLQGVVGPAGPQGPNTTTANTLFIGSDQGASQAGSRLVLGTDGNSLLTLLENGNVGIGNTNPATLTGFTFLDHMEC